MLSCGCVYVCVIMWKDGRMCFMHIFYTFVPVANILYVLLCQKKF